MNGVIERLTYLWKGEPGLRGFFGTVDHKKLGKRYIVTSIFFLLAGGVLALLMRLQLAAPENHVLGPTAYDQVFTMHGTIMIFWYAQPILTGIMVFVVPLMIGARDLAFPRLNAFTYWVYLASGLFLLASFLWGQAPDAGWFAYAPFNDRLHSPSMGMDFYALSLIFLTISTTGGAINFIVTILRHRAPGMKLSRMPLALYSTLTASLVTIFAMPPLTVALTFLELQRQWGFHFFDAHGGSAVLWQHLFWFFGHPWVYIVFLPATGFISMLLPVFSRRPIIGHKWVAFATVMTGVIGFTVWVHHMFSAGESHGPMIYFSAASMVISIFSAIQFASWTGTMVRGKPVFTTSMWFAFSFLGAFVLGGFSGVITAIVPVDWQLTDSYWVVAHLHYVLVGANLFPVLAAIYYWYPKMTGRLLNERLGKRSALLTFLGFSMTFFPMHITGLLGMTRRIFTYTGDRPGWAALNAVETVGFFIMGVGLLLTLINVIISRKHGLIAGRNPWNADTLEWDTESPPPVYGTVVLPTVTTAHPLWDDHDESYDPTLERVFDQGRYTFTTTPMDAEPVGVAKMPEDSLMPLFATVALAVVFSVLMVKQISIAAGFAIVSALCIARWQWPKPEKHVAHPHSDPVLPEFIDDKRGTWGMKWFITTEAMLFVALGFAYYYLAAQNAMWPLDKAPKWQLAVIMLVVLVLSSVAAFVAEHMEKAARYGAARIALAVAIALGILFVGLSLLEYHNHLKELVPQEDAYASVFFTIITFHFAHLLVGLGMLVWVLLQPKLHTTKPPHSALHNATMYWHFVDFIWLLIVILFFGVANWRQ